MAFWRTLAGVAVGMTATTVGVLPSSQAPSLPKTSVYVLDFEGDGLALTSARDGVDFDVEGRGTRVRVGWTQRDSDDAFLALDVDGNGSIDSARELISTRTALPGAPPLPTANEAIRILQGLRRGPDGQLPSPLPRGSAEFNRDDAAFKSVLVWVDANHDGRSSPAELKALADTIVETIYGGFQKANDVDAYRNQTLLHGIFWVTRQGVRLQRPLAIVVLAGTPDPQ